MFAFQRVDSSPTRHVVPSRGFGLFDARPVYDEAMRQGLAESDAPDTHDRSSYLAMTVSGPGFEPTGTSEVTVENEQVLLCDPETLPAAFDAAANSLKLLILVSPTCPICLDGVAVVRESLAGLDSADVSIHVVWLPVLKGDTPAAAQDSARLFGNTMQVAHYWDVERALSNRYCELLRLKERGRTVAWDLYLIYERGARWRADPPLPTLWMQQLLIAGVPELERSLLLGYLRQLLEPTEIYPAAPCRHDAAPT